MGLAIWDAVAESVKTMINLEEFGVEFTANRTREDVVESLPLLDGLRVDVQSWGCVYMQTHVSQLTYKCTTRVIVRKWLGDDAANRNQDGTIKNDIIDPYAELLQKIVEYFAPSQPNSNGRRLIDVPEAAWDAEENMKPQRAGSMLLEASMYCGWVDICHVVTVTPGVPT